MNAQRGFTLIEMAIVLTIIGLVIGGGLYTVSTIFGRSQLIQTNSSLDQAEAALTLFAVRNNRLPCPADGSLTVGASQYGMEQLAGTSPQSCAVALKNSVVPWVTLGLDEGSSVDGWGRRISYFVAGKQSGTGWDSLVDAGSGGSGASAAATLNSSNQISGFTVISGGANYAAGTYNVSFLLNGTNQATMTETLASAGPLVSQSSTITSPLFIAAPNVVFHTEGCLSRTSGVTAVGRMADCDPAATQGIAPSTPYGNYIAVYAISGGAYSSELTTAQPASITAANVASAGGRAAYVLISHGASGGYGWSKGSGTQTQPISSSTLKSYNSASSTAALAGTANNYGFVQGPPQGNARSPDSSYFDDIVRWRSPGMIIQACGAGACGNP